MTEEIREDTSGEQTQSIPTINAPSGPYGAEVEPNPPRQDMKAADEIAGGPVQDRTASPASFTGGTGGAGLGGSAEPPAPEKQPVP